MRGNRGDRAIQGGRGYGTAVSWRNDLHGNIGGCERSVEQQRLHIAAEERAVIAELYGPVAPAIFGQCAKRLCEVINRLGQLDTTPRTLQVRHRARLRTARSSRTGVQDRSDRPRTFLVLTRE